MDALITNELYTQALIFIACFTTKMQKGTNKQKSHLQR